MHVVNKKYVDKVSRNLAASYSDVFKLKSNSRLTFLGFEQVSSDLYSKWLFEDKIVYSLVTDQQVDISKNIQFQILNKPEL